MNIILGSGVIGLLAKVILGPDWQIVPFYSSRFFSFNPALDDNFIIRDERLDEFINNITGSNSGKIHSYQRVWSASGQLVKQFDDSLYYSWMYKLFGSDMPSQSRVCFNNMNLWVYDIRVNNLYKSLVNMYNNDIKSATGTVTEIGEHYLIKNGTRIDFDNMVSTIPLDALLKLMKIEYPLHAKTLHYLHVATEDLDFEGANQVLVTDQMFDFFKVTNVAPGRYLFYCHNSIPNPGIYLMQFMKQFDILDGTSIDDVIPLGQTPKLDKLEECGIYCVGSCAQWDWCMDVGSCILRLMRYSQRGNKPNKPKEFKVQDEFI